MERTILKYPFFAYQIFAERLDMLPFVYNGAAPVLISTLNPHSFYVADHDMDFKRALEDSEILLPDGVGIVYANWLINGSKLKKISGMDIFLLLLKKLHAAKEPSVKRIFFLGSTESTLDAIQKKVKGEFPSLSVDVYAPPFKPVFTREDLDLMVDRINAFDPYIIFVGMTAPKQEKWSHMNKGHLNAQLICSIGAVFDFYAGNIKRPGEIWQFFGLEWFVRFLREPLRLWKRSFISLPYFIFRVFQEAFKRRFG